MHPIGTPHGTSPNRGPLAAASWLSARDLTPQPPKWFVVITFGTSQGATLDLEIMSEEWGFRFEHERRVSWIRVTDIAFAHGHDDHELLSRTPTLREIGAFLRSLEETHQLQFETPIVRTNLDGAEPAVRSWLQTL